MVSGRSVALPLVICAVLLASCTKPPVSPPPAKTIAPDDEWKDTTWEERHDLMTWSVLPAMARSFQAFEKAENAKLTCRSCHGVDAEERSYAMPNPTLLALDPAVLPSSASAPVVDFMNSIVVPRMRELTGNPSLGCFQCHPSRRGERK
jgi:hypothetical protein